MNKTRIVYRTVFIIVLCFGVGYLVGTVLGRYIGKGKNVCQIQAPEIRTDLDADFVEWPDGTAVDEWFRTDNLLREPEGRRYNICRNGVRRDSSLVQTEAIQAVIDLAAENGGGVIVIPKGTFLSGSLFFKPGTHLYLEEGARLKGSDDISDFPVVDTRMEGQSLRYFAALVNADGLDGFSISGPGTIDGNGLRYWKAFWLRRKWNPQCTNMDEMRPRLLYLSNCRNVRIQGVHLINSPFWTCHLYRCEAVKILGVVFFSPAAPVKAPSTDAIDIDVCRKVLVKSCYMEVNDDAVALKGGKGPWADQDPNNGENTEIVIEDCVYGFCHGALTCGSESIHDRNIVLRRCRLDNCNRLLWLKMRPDTPQLYEYILVENISGNTNHFLYIRPWTQFFDLKGRTDIPISYASHITLKDIGMECGTWFNVEASDQYSLSDFTFERLELKTKNVAWNPDIIDSVTVNDIRIGE